MAVKAPLAECWDCKDGIFVPDECVVGFWHQGDFYAWAKKDENVVVYCLSCVPENTFLTIPQKGEDR
jgi:hypothetical protein